MSYHPGQTWGLTVHQNVDPRIQGIAARAVLALEKLGPEERAQAQLELEKGLAILEWVARGGALA